MIKICHVKYVLVWILMHKIHMDIAKIFVGLLDFGYIISTHFDVLLLCYSIIFILSPLFL